MTNPNSKIQKTFIKSFKPAFNGLKYVFKNERNFRLHIVIGLIVLILAIYLNCSLIEIMFLVIVISIVLITEIINSAIEYTWDKLEPNHHPVVGIIKDVMAGSVLIASLSAGLVGVLMLLRHLI